MLSDAPELIARVRRGDPTARDQLFGHYRQYLAVLAQAQIGRHLRGKCDASDLVQQTLLEAHRDFSQFTGSREPELLAWLRQILAHNLFNETRRFAAGQRNVAREVSLDQLRARLDQSSLILGNCLAADGPRPSETATEREAAVQMADLLSRLPSDYRTVVLLRVFEGMPAEEVAERMNRTPGAVRMLQLRALTALRAEMDRNSSQ
jgi:RNA polymerase sigma-70 factor (ECF subfamily)